MILIPQRLFESKDVTTILRDGNVCILSKELTKPVVNREGYISNLVVSILLSGEQHIRTYDDHLIKVKPNEALFIPRGMYYVSDLLPAGGSFKSLLFYFDVTPQQWLKERRLEKARRLIEEKEISVTELAYEVGYENISYFIRAFGDQFGQTPKQYILSLHRNNLQN